jgi:peptide deformylase
MAVRSIVVVPHQILSSQAAPVTDIDGEVRKLVADMIDTMYKAPGIGLAANQVGQLLQLIVYDIIYPYAEPKKRKKSPVCLINPTICSTEGEEVREEGCLSVPDFQIEIKRPACVQVDGIDLDGKPVRIEAEGLLARVLQHEIDHLRGTTLLEHASGIKRNLYRRRMRKHSRREE